MINEVKIVESMQDGVISLTYLCPIRNVEKEREVTIANKFVEPTNGSDIAGVVNESLICYDVEFRKWCEIPLHSIIKWKKLT